MLYIILFIKQGASLSDDQIVLYSDLADLKEGVLTGEVRYQTKMINQE